LNTVHAQYVVNVSEPANIAGKYTMARAAFGGAWRDTIKGTLKLADNGAGSTLACDTILGVAGKIAVIDRGTCAFIDKSLKAERAGAIAVIICNNAAGAAFAFGPKDYTTVKIPVAMLSMADCIKLKVSINDAKASIYFNNPTTNATVLWKEDFKNRLMGWTTKARNLPIDTFSWDRRGMSDGIARGEIQSPTAENGAAIFDADYKTSKGDVNNIPANPPYPRHHGELISPII
jgi:hypothetical protein